MAGTALASAAVKFGFVFVKLLLLLLYVNVKHREACTDDDLDAAVPD
jgi:hypothetical protein